jgi:hypothetical protein
MFSSAMLLSVDGCRNAGSTNGFDTERKEVNGRDMIFRHTKHKSSFRSRERHHISRSLYYAANNERYGIVPEGR